MPLLARHFGKRLIVTRLLAELDQVGAGKAGLGDVAQVLLGDLYGLLLAVETEKEADEHLGGKGRSFLLRLRRNRGPSRCIAL